jgi:hypothetical protein
MFAEKPVVNLAEFEREKRATRIPVAPSSQDTVLRSPDFRLSGAGKKAKDLIGLLIGHGARIRRAARPQCRITLQVLTPAGLQAVEMSFDQD